MQTICFAKQSHRFFSLFSLIFYLEKVALEKSEKEKNEKRKIQKEKAADATFSFWWRWR